MVPGVIGCIPEYRGVTGTPLGVNGPHGPRWEEIGAARVGRAPPLPLVRIGLGGGAAPPSFLPPLPLPFPPPSRSRKGGVLLRGSPTKGESYSY